MHEHLYAVIIAGGKGTRFWPLSRKRMPKQLLGITSERTMVQSTVDRVLPIVPAERIFVVTADVHADELRKQLPELPERNLIVEPVGRNTAPCIGLAAMHLIRIDPEATMLVLPADHLIKDVGEFQAKLLVAAEVAQNRYNLVTLGITPTRPETGYGYIQLGPEADRVQETAVFKVSSFREKPNVETAESFINSGNFLWNSGMYVWRASAIIANIERFLPKVYRQLLRIRVAIGSDREQDVMAEIYPGIESISIDYGVMERAAQVFSIQADFGWSDVGSWSALKDIWPLDENQNAVNGKPVVSVNSSHSIIYSPSKVVALVNMSNLIVVETEDALLICRQNQAQDVKKVVEMLEEKGLTELL